MGDRGQAVLNYGMGDDKYRGEGKIFFYTHWYGSALPELVAEALKKGRARWGDNTYLARFIVTSLARNMGRPDDLTGSGIAPYYIDSENEDVEILLNEKSVMFRGSSYTFDEFVDKYTK